MFEYEEKTLGNRVQAEKRDKLLRKLFFCLKRKKKNNLSKGGGARSKTHKIGLRRKRRLYKCKTKSGQKQKTRKKTENQGPKNLSRSYRLILLKRKIEENIELLHLMKKK